MVKRKSTKSKKSSKGGKAAKASKRKQVTQVARLFMDVVSAHSYQQGLHRKVRGLTNLTFWAGAGFSKAWDPRAPIGSELFTLKSEVIERVASNLALHRMFGYDSFKGLTPDQLRQIVYQVDMQERYPDVRSRYMDEQNLRLVRAALRAAVVSRYDEIAKLNYFDQKQEKFPLSNSSAAQRDILGFFRHLLEQADGSDVLVEGIRTHFVTTNYDYVIETILDNVLNPDDSLFIYTYRGFTPLQVCGAANITPLHAHWLVWHLLKINGGFEILRRGDDYVLDYSNRKAADIIRDPPVLMLPSREQDYSDPYFRTIFPKAVRLLRETSVLVLVGYSLPDDDALVRFILRQFAEEGEDGRRKMIFYIDPSAEEKKRELLKQVFPATDSFAGVPRVEVYNGTFSEFARECMSIIGRPRR